MEGQVPPSGACPSLYLSVVFPASIRRSEPQRLNAFVVRRISLQSTHGQSLELPVAVERFEARLAADPVGEVDFGLHGFLQKAQRGEADQVRRAKVRSSSR